MTKKQRLELTWIGKEIRPKLEPRILLEDTDKSYHATHRVSDTDIFDNRLIFGDNLLALKALEQEFTGKIKCIFIDPPYNTGSAFEHYDDGVEHSTWLSLMRDRLEIIRNLLSEDGSLWITIDDNEAHYLKVVCDEIFGRTNFVANVIWQKKYAPANDALWFSDSHDHLLVFAKNKSIWRPNKLARTSKQNQLYSNPDNDPRGAWMSDNYTCAKSVNERPNLYYAIRNPNTNEEIWPKKTRVWAFDKSTHEQHIKENRIYWGKDGKNTTPRLKKFLSELRSQGRVSSTIWLHEEVGHTQDARREMLALNPKNPFATPKPERLIQQIIEIATNYNDLVLDSFAGSGTTGAVAHKMGRRWIMIELGEHCHTHIIPRLKKVIDGEDKGGITQAVNWKGGGGFRYYRLAPSLLEKDKWGNWIINKQYNPAMLAEALCKLEGFTYVPSDTFYWQHGYSTERDFIYVTTQNLSHEQLSKLSDEVGEERTLLVLCSSYRSKADIFPNLTIKKIPQQILSRCEWGRDDYSLDIKNLPKARPTVEEISPPKSLQPPPLQQSLFDIDKV
ncbi:MAG: site-specific DNA-methyltransferase [Nostoc sp. CreGUA01]|nr:site-specific DNA-methyltransferase [Nostoc sp. CreGUA01]